MDGRRVTLVQCMPTRSPGRGGDMPDDTEDEELEFEMPAWLVVEMCLVIGFLLGALLT